MMDKVVQSGIEEKTNLKEILLQRDQDRKAKLKNVKEEKELNAPDQTKAFNESFEENSEKISNLIKLIEDRKVEQRDLPNHFSKISKDLQVLNRHLSVSTVFLTNYKVRKCLQTIEDFEARIKQLESEFLPKKKFGFKTRKAKSTDKIRKQVDEIDANVIKPVVFETISCGFFDKKCERLRLESDEIAKKDVELRNLEDCTVLLCGCPGTVHISNVKRCRILIGPVSTSVFVDNCQESTLAIACQQLRIHCTKQSSFYIHVTSRAIIEDSVHVKFAPYSLGYDGIEKHFEISGLDRDQNNWNQIDDFNWLASDVPSPNWEVIKEEERDTDWDTSLIFH